MRKVLFNLLFWVLFFLIWDRVMYYYIDNNLNRLYFTALDVGLVIVAFYLIYLYVMPIYLRKKKIWILLLSCAALLTILSVGAYWLMLVFLRHQLMPIHFDFYWNYEDMQYNRFFIALIGILGGCFVKLAMDRANLGRRMERMEKERSIAELTYLKSQINPHFLFNSLNSLYAQMDLNPEGARGTLTSLAELLRYQLYDCNTDQIPFKKEVQYLQNYYALQSLRMDNCTCRMEADEPAADLYIAPLLLIPFVENAFKYVSDEDDGGNLIDIRLSLEGTRLQFSCVNTVTQSRDIAVRSGVVAEGKATGEGGEAAGRVRSGGHEWERRGGGIGLANVKKRLELIYGKDYQLRVEEKDNLYRVNLEINLATKAPKNAQLSDHR